MNLKSLELKILLQKRQHCAIEECNKPKVQRFSVKVKKEAQEHSVVIALSLCGVEEDGQVHILLKRGWHFEFKLKTNFVIID